jgi:hypothetical protein
VSLRHHTHIYTPHTHTHIHITQAAAAAQRGSNYTKNISKLKRKAPLKFYTHQDLGVSIDIEREGKVPAFAFIHCNCLGT